MAATAPTYDLVLLLDPRGEEEARAKIVADAKAMIAGDGELVRHDEWGERALAYPIEHRATAEYHLLQFHAAKTSLIAELNRVLHIADGVLRFRVNKLQPGTPEPPDLKADRGGAGTRDAAPARGGEAEAARTEEPAAA
jgi:small subunit ribosomal protein S6